MRRLFLFLLALLLPVSAWAISGDGGTVLVVQNGKVFMSGTSGGVPYFSAATTISSSAALTANAIVLGGGAGAAPATPVGLGTTTQVLHGNAAGAPSFAAVSLTADVTGTLPIGNGGTNSSAALTNSKCMRSSGGAIVEAGGDCATAGQNLVVFGSNGDLTQNTTTWVNGSTVDISEARVQAVVANGVSLNNLKCVSSVLPGASQTYVVTMTTGVCTGALTASTNQVCTIDNTSRIGCTTPATTAQAITAGQCFAFKIVTSATAATGTVTCSAERTA